MYERGYALKKIFILFIVMFALVSCKLDETKSEKNISIEELDYKITSTWIYANNFESSRSEKSIITRPPGLEQLIFSFTIPQEGGLVDQKHCVYFTAAYKEKKSKFSAYSLTPSGPCPEVSPESNVIFNIENLEKFKFSFEEFKLHLEFSFQKMNYKLIIPLPNIEGVLKHEKVHSLSYKAFKPGMKILKISEDTFDFAANKNLGKISDRFSLGTAIRCQKVNSNCENVGENRCLDCRYGWYEVVDFQCPQGGTKFCGQNHCGEKNEPACPRGTKVVPIEEAGICQSDLEPILNSDKILVCQ